jgi:hypothetical protein
MAIVQALPNSFKQQLLDGDHDFSTLGSGGDKFKLALYVSTATLGAATTSYTTNGQVSSSGTNYTTGGKSLVNSGTSLSSTKAFTNFADLSFQNVTLTARGCLIYNTSFNNAAVAVLSFTTDKTATAGTFTVQFPAFTSSAAIIRIS